MPTFSRTALLTAAGAGHTLYRSDKDTAKPSSVSTCTGGCATTWPPAPAGHHVQVQGVDSAPVGSVTRPDGTEQLALNGWPLYRYAPDAKPGDTKGQGVGGTWFASTPEGKKATAAASPAARGADAGSSGSGAGAGAGY